MKNNTSFRMLYDYLKSMEVCSSQADMGDELGVSPRTISVWCNKGYPGSSAQVTTIYIFKKYFQNNTQLMVGFLNYVIQNGFDIPEQQKGLDSFQIFLNYFLCSDASAAGKPPRKVSPVLPPCTEDEVYYPQSLLLKETNELLLTLSDRSSCDPSKISGRKRLLIEAPGGQGKSLFLRKLQKALLNNSAYQYVVCFDLTDLLLHSEAELRRADTPQSERLRRILCQLKHMGIDIASFVSCAAKKAKASGEVVLLLDGLNEIFSSSDYKGTQAILNEIEYISREWNNSTILITTRQLQESFAFLTDFTPCTLSGTPQKELDLFLRQNDHFSEAVKALASIPMYYNALTRSNDREQVKTKYDVLKILYRKRYEQSPKDADSFFAFFILAPFIAREIHDSNKNSISFNSILAVAKDLKSKNLAALLQAARKECGLPFLICEPNVDNACSILLHNGPLNRIADTDPEYRMDHKNEYKIFHDDIRDYLLAFSAVTALDALRDSLEDGHFEFVQDIHVNLNLRDDPMKLFRDRLGLSCAEDIQRNLSRIYAVLYDVRISPQAILFAHTLFLISDYLDLGEKAVIPTHEILIRFTERIVRLVKQGNFNNCLKEDNQWIEEPQQLRCKLELSSIFSKHCEYFRKQGEFLKGLELADVAQKILPESDAVKHQKSKILLRMYEAHVKNSEEYCLAALGFDTYTDLFSEGKRLLEEAAAEDFNLSINLAGMLYSTPPMYLLEDEATRVDFDWVKAFHFYRSLIFTEKEKVVHTAKEICYTVRQAVGFLLKGYVRFNPDFDKYEGDDPGEDSIVSGSRNSLALDANTLALAKYLLQFVDGMSSSFLNYYRGIIAYYDGDLPSVEKLFRSESNNILSSLFLCHLFDEKIDLDTYYHTLMQQIQDPQNDSIESTNPLYRYCDAKALELSFDENRRTYFAELEQALPERKRLIAQRLTQR